jgi:hypothetical protein
MTISLDLQGADAIGANVKTNTTSKLKKSASKKRAPVKTFKASNKVGRTPSISDVRSSMANKKITPEEAGSLNSKAGFKPDANDVAEALNKGHIKVSEAEDLLGRKARSYQPSPKSEPRFVPSEDLSAQPSSTLAPQLMQKSQQPQLMQKSQQFKNNN